MDTVSLGQKEANMSLNGFSKAQPSNLSGKAKKKKKFNSIFSKKKRNVYNQENKVFVGGLKNSVSNSLLLSYFSKFGKVLQIDVVKTGSTARRRGFCFIVFENPHDAEEVILKKVHMVGENVLEAKESYSRKKELRGEELSFPQRISAFLKENEGNYAKLREEYFSYKLMVTSK